MALFSHSHRIDRPFPPLFHLLEEFDTYVRQAGGYNAEWQPKFDIHETKDAYELNGELAGLKKDNVNIEFTDPQTLHIFGQVERKTTLGPKAGDAAQKEDSKQPKAWLTECSVGKFARVFTFPSRIDSSKVSAKMNDGILTVVVPKVDTHEAQKITIK